MAWKIEDLSIIHEQKADQGVERTVDQHMHEEQTTKEKYVNRSTRSESRISKISKATHQWREEWQYDCAPLQLFLQLLRTYGFEDGEDWKIFPVDPGDVSKGQVVFFQTLGDVQKCFW